jgi:FtsZ-interacting cell division protein YlmF
VELSLPIKISIRKLLCYEELEDTKGVIRIRKLKDRQQNAQKQRGQRDKQRSTKHTYTTKDGVTRTLLKTEGELRCSGRVGSCQFQSKIYSEASSEMQRVREGNYVFVDLFGWQCFLSKYRVELVTY